MPPQGDDIAIEKNLDLVLDMARAEYDGILYKTWATQSAKLYTYLWLSVAICSAGGAVYATMLNGQYNNTFILTCTLISMFCAFVAFCVGVDAMRSRNNVARPIYGEDYSYFIKLAKDGRYDKELRIYAIEAFANSTKTQGSEVHSLGIRMRCISVILVISAVIGGLAFGGYAIAKVFSQ